MEFIGRLIEKNKNKGRLKGIKLFSRCDPFSHQQFVDETIMGQEASVKEAKVMKEMLDLYIRGLGQLINWEQSLVYFINTSKDRKKKIVRILGCGVGKLTSTYLGLPLGTKPLDSF